MAHSDTSSRRVKFGSNRAIADIAQTRTSVAALTSRPRLPTRARKRNAAQVGSPLQSSGFAHVPRAALPQSYTKFVSERKGDTTAADLLSLSAYDPNRSFAPRICIALSQSNRLSNFQSSPRQVLNLLLRGKEHGGNPKVSCISLLQPR